MRTLTLSSGHQLHYIDAEEVDRKKKDAKYQNELKDEERSDITVHVYEGGFKVWECSAFLCNQLSENDVRGKSVLELGCGAGLPTIFAMHLGASKCTVQDYNKSVIDCFTKPNFDANGLTEKDVEYIHGGWADMELNGKKFDVILSSETIYNESDYGALASAIERTMEKDGFAYIASKSFYFGVGGNALGFMDYVNTKTSLKATMKTEDTSKSPSLCILMLKFA